MKIQQLKEKIKDLDGKPIGEPTIVVDIILEQVKNSPVSRAGIIEGLEKLKEEVDTYTFGKVYEKAIFASIEKAEADKFVEALELAQKLRKEGEDFSIDQLKVIQDRTAKLQLNGMTTYELGLLKAMAIKNLNWEETKDKKAKD